MSLEFLGSRFEHIRISYNLLTRGPGRRPYTYVSD